MKIRYYGLVQKLFMKTLSFKSEWTIELLNLNPASKAISCKKIPKVTFEIVLEKCQKKGEGTEEKRRGDEKTRKEEND